VCTRSGPAVGRSPRARGSPPGDGDRLIRAGPIPASAGKPSPSPRAPSTRRADPRERGEAWTVSAADGTVTGRSPRARGSQLVRRDAGRGDGPIPASAGKPPPHGGTRRARRADPRERGEAERGQRRRRGELGRSPRARGSHRLRQGELRRDGPIPASAGKPPATSVGSAIPRADPRERGEAVPLGIGPRSFTGRSPRARGSPPVIEKEKAPCRPIPASAGKPGGGSGCPARRGADPRERGEARRPARLSGAPPGRSPRARGSPARRLSVLQGAGPIPASAGKPRPRRATSRATRADPRERGEAAAIVTVPSAAPGRSPRARGSREPADEPLPLRGPIPASAGKPSGPRARARSTRADPRERGEALLATPRSPPVRADPRERGEAALRVGGAA